MNAMCVDPEADFSRMGRLLIPDFRAKTYPDSSGTQQANKERSIVNYYILYFIRAAPARLLIYDITRLGKCFDRFLLLHLRKMKMAT